MDRSIRRSALVAGVLSTALVAATAFGAAAQDAGTAMVRVLHASPDAPAVDVYADGAAVLTNVAYGVISNYLEVPAGDHHIQVFATGADAATETPVIDATITLAADTMTTVAATNSVESIEAQVIADAPAPTRDAAQIRWVNLAADLPPVDVAPDGGDDLIAGLAYPAASEYLTFAPGQVDVELQPSGAVSGWVAYNPGGVLVAGGSSYTEFIIGAHGDGAVRVVTAIDETLPPPMAYVRVLHASPDAGNVDLWIDEEPVATDIPFGTLSDYIALDGTHHRFQIYPTGTDPEAEEAPRYISTILFLSPGQVGTLVASNTVERIQPIFLNDDPAEVADKASIRVVNLVPDATAAGAAKAGKAAFASELGYGQASAYLPLPGGKQNLTVDVTGETGGAAIEVDRFNAPKGHAFTIFVVGSVAGESLDAIVGDDDAGED